MVKDNLSKNIVAYLGDYKPFLDKTKEAGNINNSKPNLNEGESKEEREIGIRELPFI